MKYCTECKHSYKSMKEAPCKTCVYDPNSPNYEPRIRIEFSTERVKEKLEKARIEIERKTSQLVGIVHPSGLSQKIYWFETPYCLEEGMEVLVEEEDGTRAWGRVAVSSVPFDDEQIEFVEDMGEEIGRVVGIFTPFHKCEE